LGGTFNPIHIGHLAIAQTAFEKLKLEKVIFVPSNLPPHKKGRDLVPAKKRYQMVELAIKKYNHFDASSFEIKKEGKSYSVDTVKYFNLLYPNKKLYFIVGEDSLPTLNKWKDINEIIRYVQFVVINRDGSIHRKSPINVKSLSMPSLDIASSQIREQIKSKRRVDFLLPHLVWNYIKRDNLYSK